MVKISSFLYCALFFYLFILSCTTVKNKYGINRFKLSRFTLKPNLNDYAYKYIDTSAFYLNIEVNDKDFILDNAGSPKSIASLGKGLKFYEKGRVAFFDQVDLSNVLTLDPHKAMMGIYNFSNKGIFIEHIANSPQAGNFSVREEVKISGDTLTTLYNNYEYKYLKKKLPMHFLIYKPDW